MYNRKFVSVVVGSWLSLAASAAFSQAEESPMPGSAQGEPAPTTAKTDSTGTGTTTNVSKPSLPKKLFGFVIGTIVGTPVCVVRKTIEEEKYAINGMISTSDNKAAMTAAGAFWLPFAIFTGALESPVFAAKDSLNAEKPFSKEQFSLGNVKVKSTQTLPGSQ